MKGTESPITVQSTMQEVLDAYPGAQRALFRKYHIGGCSSCAFQPTETLEEVCARNNQLSPGEVLEYLRASHGEDEKVLISPQDLQAAQAADPALKLLDIRSRQEFEAVHIDGSVLLSQPVMQEIMSRWPREQSIVIIDHRGRSALDAAAYFIGHGFGRVQCLRGGIDAWAREVDPKMRRYRLG